MSGTLSNTNLAVDSTNSYEAVTLSTSSTTITDNPALAFKRTATPTGSITTSYPGVIQGQGKAQNGVSNYCYDMQLRSTSISSITTSQTGTCYFTSYNTNSSNVPVAQTTLQHNQTTLRYVDVGLGAGSLGTGGTIFNVGITSIGPNVNYDNYLSCGSASYRYTIVYATTGTINTSDANQKEQIVDLDAAELRVATAIKSMIKKFKWKDAVAKKGDAARLHVGVIAQEVEAAFIAEGLEPAKYALFCEDVWWEKMVPNPDYHVRWFKEMPNPKWTEGGTEPEVVMVQFETEVEGGIAVPHGQPEILEAFPEEVEGGTKVVRKGIRYDQLLAFVIAAM